MQRNDLDLENWKDCLDDVLLDSLWLFPERDRSGAHNACFHGNFVPQLPHQLMRRYTKRGDWVLDPFMGAGTTLIECLRLGRHSVGIELESNVYQQALQNINTEPNPHNVICMPLQGNSLNATCYSKEIKFHLIIMHPPYHNIINFGDNTFNLCNMTLPDFIESIGRVAGTLKDALAENGTLVLVMSDIYTQSQWFPLGFACMQSIQAHTSMLLRSIAVKNFENTQGKRNKQQLWKYRALKGGYYLFKHEYIFIFQH